VSLFIEPYDAKRAVVPLAGQLGATATLRQRRGEHWITVMGDVPSATLKAFAEALERRR
jgi:sigma-E factor negative regulatory protein RseB